MLDEYLKRDDTKNFINLINTNERYFKKEEFNFSYSFFSDQKLALYIFYDALIKYKIILDDIYLFDEYLEQLEKLFKKLDSFSDIRIGINKLIGKMVSIKLEIKNINDDLSKKQIISFIYNKYILDGYFVHGFCSSYSNEIKNKDFIPEDYFNYYKDFSAIDKIFFKHNVINIFQKDFLDKKVYFTDDFVNACYYSTFAPMFFYNFLNNKDYFLKEVRVDKSLINNYNNWTKNLKMFMFDSFFYEEEKNFVNEVVKKQWDFIHKNKNVISLLLVKRVRLEEVNSLEDYLDDNNEFYEVIDRMLSSKLGNVLCREKIDKNDIEILELDNYLSDSVENSIINVQDEFIKYKEEDVGRQFLNVYGKASIFILLGALFISLGVIISIVLIIREIL